MVFWCWLVLSDATQMRCGSLELIGALQSFTEAAWAHWVFLGILGAAVPCRSLDSLGILGEVIIPRKPSSQLFSPRQLPDAPWGSVELPGAPWNSLVLDCKANLRAGGRQNKKGLMNLPGDLGSCMGLHG